MSVEPDTADQQGPEEIKPPSRKVRVLTSWKLWTVLLVLGLVGIGVSLTMPIVHRLRALAYFDLHKDIEYELSPEHEDWPEKYGEWTNALREVDTVWAMAATDDTLLHAAAMHEAESVSLIESEAHPITHRGAASLRPFERMQVLELRGQGFTDEAIAAMLGARPPLESVQLVSTGAARQTLLALSRIPSIEDLTLFTRSLDDGDFRELQPLDSLYLVMVAGAGDECAKWLATSPELASVHLYFSPISNEGMRSLSQCRKLEWLNIHGGMMTDDGLQYLADTPTLQYLILNDCPNLTADGIARLPDLPELVCLALPVELLTTESIARLKEFPNLYNLELYGSLEHDSELKRQLDEKWTYSEEPPPMPSADEFWEGIRRGL